jgi:uncharacterized membrane protein
VTPSVRREALVALVLGGVAGVVVAVWIRVGVGILVGYDVVVLIYLVRVWHMIWPMDAEGTSTHAAREDPARSAADLVLLSAALASLGAIAVVIAQSHSSEGWVKAVEVGVGAASVAISWLLVHTIFTLKYARLYYRGGASGKEGGVDFEHAVRPPYTDFAYLAFTIGMTFQVSDTDLQSVEYRRLALRHALMSYLFGAVILAGAINLIASLAN